jgi:NADP-dependent 3-hydroxy acid dehydrogenase YdfG
MMMRKPRLCLCKRRAQAEDVANAVVYVVTQPEKVCINKILIRPSQQPN